MSDNRVVTEKADRLRGIALPVIVMVSLMWLIEVMDTFLSGALDQYGIVSRTSDGLVGIAASPLLHGDFGHLLANTVPFLVLGLLVAWRSDGRIWPITVTIAVAGGFAVWLLGPANVITIGASGLIFGFFAYLITAGILTKHWLDIIVAILVVVAYGGMVWGMLPFTVGPEVSWLAHLTGAAAGVLAALLFVRRPGDARTSAVSP